MPDCSRIDALVTPFVDGELPSGEQQAISTHIANCAACRAKVMAERAVRALVKARQPELTRSAAPPALRARCAMMKGAGARSTAEPPAARTLPARSSSWRARFAPFALAATLVFAVGGAFLYQATRSSSRVLAAELALDHEKCFRLNRVLGTQHSAETVEAAMASGFDWDVQLPETSGRDDVSLVGSRPCLSGEGKVAHIMYRHHGQPVSLFMVPGEARPDQIVEVFGHQCRIWSQGDRTFVLVARESPAELERMAALVRTTIR
jgi:anti-sigma factor RsiW